MGVGAAGKRTVAAAAQVSPFDEGLTRPGTRGLAHVGLGAIVGGWAGASLSAGSDIVTPDKAAPLRRRYVHRYEDC
jgi:hypothetical protein